MKNSFFDPKLFWFAPARTQWDPDNPAMLRTIVQQVLTHGRMEDVKILLTNVPRQQFHAVFERIKPFLPKEIRSFWEVYFENHQ
jgi:hypothetical protein